MLKPSEDRTLAFFESLIIDSNGIKELREIFFNGVKESFVSTHIESPEDDVILAFDRDDYDNIIELSNDFNDFLKRRLNKEKQIAKELIASKSAKTLSTSSPNNSFFFFTESSLIELKNKSNNVSYRIVYDTIIDLMRFFHAKYNKYHKFSAKYLDTLSIYRKESKTNKISLSFNWREENKKREIKFLYSKLIHAEPPFINTSLETFIKAFTDKPLEADEYIKWLCVSAKNKKIISQVTLITLVESLFNSGYITSDLNDL